MQLEVVYATPEQTLQHHVEVPSNATIQQLLDVLAEQPEWRDISKNAAAIAVFGQRVTSSYQLQAGDRVELLRPLLVSPMEARRLRARKQKL